MSLLSDLRQRPPRLSKAARFTSACGIVYLVGGGVLLAWPEQLQTIYGYAPFNGLERSLVVVIGMLLAIVGWFYYFGGRTGGRQFIAATVIDRLVLVPPVLLSVAASGTLPHLMGAFAVLDPVLALIAWRLLATSEP